jgi:hypothetical protein
MISRRYVASLAAGILIFTIAAPRVQAQQQAAVRVPRAVLERYVGEYAYSNGSTVNITVSGDTLFREISGQRVPFVPISQNSFRVGPVFTAEFVSDGAGGMTQILSDGVDVEHRLLRKGSRPAAPAALPAASVRVPRSVLERYVGVYEFIPGQMKRTDLRIVIGLKGDTLFRKMGAQETVLTPVSNTRFKVGTTLLMVDFVIDDAGVTQVMGSGFQQLLARLTSK